MPHLYQNSSANAMTMFAVAMGLQLRKESIRQTLNDNQSRISLSNRIIRNVFSEIHHSGKRLSHRKYTYLIAEYKIREEGDVLWIWKNKGDDVIQATIADLISDNFDLFFDTLVSLWGKAFLELKDEDLLIKN